jgi:hypothetical protein
MHARMKFRVRTVRLYDVEYQTTSTRYRMVLEILLGLQLYFEFFFSLKASGFEIKRTFITGIVYLLRRFNVTK